MDSPVLLVIDVQREYFSPRSPLRIPDGLAVLDQLSGLVESARAAGVPIVHIRHEEEPGSGVFEPGSDEVETMDEVAPQGDEPVITKHLPGSFDGTDLQDTLEELGARTVIVGGFMTHMCCDTTAREAQALGYDVVFLTDGTATRDLTAPDGEVVPHDVVQQTILAAQADGFSTPQTVAEVRDAL